MSAWNELQQWLMMNVGSKEAEQCNEIVRRIALDAVKASDPATVGGGPYYHVEMVGGRDSEPVPQINRDPLSYWKNKP